MSNLEASEFSDYAFGQAARLFLAVSDEARLRLLVLLAAGEKSVGDIAAVTGEGLSTVSQRLKILRNEKLIASRRDGKFIYYRLLDQHIADIVVGTLKYVETKDER